MAHWSIGYRFRFTPEPVAYGATSDDGDPATTNERTEAT
jgi:hypothetical protein